MAGTAGTRRVMARSSSFRGLMTWGSSSMAGGAPREGSPVPHNLLDHLRETIRPLPFIPTALGALQSSHTRVQMGLDQPRILFAGAVAATAGEQRVARIDDPATGGAHRMPPVSAFRCHGRINGTPGTLRGRGDHFTWTPDDGRTRVRNGAFVSDHRSQVLQGDGSGRFYYLLWTGKNNITARSGRDVIADTDALVDFAGGRGRAIVMGQWITPIDSSGQRSGCTAVNSHQRSRYGAHFLDLQKILTSQAGLTAPPVEGLGLWRSSTVQADVRAGHVPRALVARDGFHLNGWGNHLVAWALIEKMKELQWL
jgi:hypothetical protein